VITVRPVGEIPGDLRRSYLDALREPQELSVEELLVKPGQRWLVEEGGERVAYAVVSDSVLVEIHCPAPAARRLAEISQAVIETAAVRRVVSKSFDSQLMFVALASANPPQTLGLLYRDVVDPGFVERPGISVRLAGPAELAAAKAVDPSFFDDDQVTAALIAENGLFFYQQEGEGLLGCGLLKRLVDGRDDFDLGMAVAPQRRGQRLGAYIIAHLKTLCLNRGVRPICGHHVSNVASQRSLERAGFAALHRLVQFEL